MRQRLCGRAMILRKWRSCCGGIFVHKSQVYQLSRRDIMPMIQVGNIKNQ
jgi:hypothetical protein